MTYNAPNQYKQSAVFTATPEELTLMLYDGAIKFMNIAKYHIENNNVVKSHETLIRAQDIIIELNSSLDMKYEVSEIYVIRFRIRKIDRCQYGKK